MSTAAEILAALRFELSRLARPGALAFALACVALAVRAGCATLENHAMVLQSAGAGATAQDVFLGTLCDSTATGLFLPLGASELLGGMACGDAESGMRDVLLTRLRHRSVWWLAKVLCALVSVAVALAAPRGRRASTLAPTAALLALSWAPVALGAPPSAWGAGRAALASLLPTALVTGASALAVRLGERGASRPRALLALGAPVLVGSAIVRSGSAPALSVPPVAPRPRGAGRQARPRGEGALRPRPHPGGGPRGGASRLWPRGVGGGLEAFRLRAHGGRPAQERLPEAGRPRAGRACRAGGGDHFGAALAGRWPTGTLTQST